LLFIRKSIRLVNQEQTEPEVNCLVSQFCVMFFLGGRRYDFNNNTVVFIKE